MVTILSSLDCPCEREVLHPEDTDGAKIGMCQRSLKIFSSETRAKLIFHQSVHGDVRFLQEFASRERFHQMPDSLTIDRWTLGCADQHLHSFHKVAGCREFLDSLAMLEQVQNSSVI